MSILKGIANMIDALNTDLNSYNEKEKLFIRTTREILIKHNEPKAVKALDEIIDEIDKRSY